MKKIFMFATMLFALVACQKIDDASDVAGGSADALTPTKSFTFHVKGDFTKSFEEMTRAAVRLEDNNTAGVTDLWVFDYVDGVCQQQVHQSSTDEGFGTVAMSLTYGHHDIKFVASKGETPSLTASALSWSRVKDTFVLDYPVDVVASSNGNRAPELKRAVGGIAVLATDAVPTNAKEIRISSLRSLSLSLPSLSVSDAVANTVTMAFPASWLGTSNNTMNTYTLMGDEDVTTDVRIQVIATDNSTISDFTIEDVALKKNRITTLKGECFGRGSGFSVSIDDAWEDGVTVTF